MPVFLAACGATEAATISICLPSACTDPRGKEHHSSQLQLWSPATSQKQTHEAQFSRPLLPDLGNLKVSC